MSDLAPIFAYTDPRLGDAMTNGLVNVDDDGVLANVQAAIGRQHPQVHPVPPRGDRVCLVGSGPTLNDTADELRDLVFAGAKLVTMNGAYHWCLERNLQPRTQIVLDARPSNARFVDPVTPQCRYMVASQCAPDTWNAVAGRENVWIFHASTGDDTPVSRELDAYYGQGRWCPIGGGVTVATRAIMLLRLLGYLRFDLFGVDSCWKGAEHHAFPQPENARDKRMEVTIDGGGLPPRRFICSPWQLKQAEDFANIIRIHGDEFLLNVHGDGMLAYLLQTGASVQDAAIATDAPAVSEPGLPA